MTCKRCGAETPQNARYCPVCGRPINYTPNLKKRGNGQGTAIKRGKTWTGIANGYKYIGDDGKLHRVRPSKGGFRTKREALAWAVSAKEKEKPIPKLIELWDGYKQSEFLKLSPSKQTAYKIARQRLESIISRRIDTLTVDELQNVVNNECKTYYPAKDVRDLLSNLYRRAMASNSHQVTQNLSRFIVLPDYEEKEAVPFSEDELATLWKSYESGDIFVGYILLMCYTGMMTGELLKCQRSMIDLAACEIRGAGAKTNTRRKAAIAFPEFLRPVLETLLEIKSDNSNAKNVKLVSMNADNFYKRFYASLEKAGIDNPETDGRHRLTPYSCRHTYGTEAVRAGFHPAVIQQMLRHSNTKTQEKYTHLASEDIHDAVNKMPKTYG